MKVIIDAQLPVKLCEILITLGFEPTHVDFLPRKDETSDSEIMEYADENDLFVITKDSDFYHSHMVLKKPQKLFLITTGNIKNHQLFNLFRNNNLLILDLLKSCTFVELSKEGLTGHS